MMIVWIKIKGQISKINVKRKKKIDVQKFFPNSKMIYHNSLYIIY